MPSPIVCRWASHIHLWLTLYIGQCITEGGLTSETIFYALQHLFLYAGQVSVKALGSYTVDAGTMANAFAGLPLSKT
jgi:hypothetical protein